MDGLMRASGSSKGVAAAKLWLEVFAERVRGVDCREEAIGLGAFDDRLRAEAGVIVKGTGETVD